MARTLSVAARIAELVEARANCHSSGNAEWFQRHTETLGEVIRDHLPSGSGIDAGCVLCLASCKRDRIVIDVPFHCMSDGYYTGWRTFKVVARPAFQSIDITVTGRDVNGVKGYLAEVFHEALTRMIPIIASLAEA
jgi:hypothetical protein